MPDPWKNNTSIFAKEEGSVMEEKGMNGIKKCAKNRKYNEIRISGLLLDLKNLNDMTFFVNWIFINFLNKNAIIPARSPNGQRVIHSGF